MALQENEVLARDIIKGSAVIRFPSNHESDNNLKTLYIVEKDDVDLNPRDKKNPSIFLQASYQARISEKPERGESCPLYCKFGIHNFMVVHFEKYVPSTIPQEILSRGIKIRVGQRTKELYKFFGHSGSQLKGKNSKSCVLYNSELEGDENYQAMISSFGNFDEIKNVAKRAARIGLLLSTAEPCAYLTDDDIKEKPDIERRGFNFTDGCGFISLKVAKEVMGQLVERKKMTEESYKSHLHKVPSVFQVRIQGCKGVLMLDPGLAKGIKIRPSMQKFEWNIKLSPGPYPLGITDNGWSRPNRIGHLNEQFIRLLSALGVQDEVFLGKQKTYLKELAQLDVRLDGAERSRINEIRNIQIRHLCANEHFDLAEQLLLGEKPDQRTLRVLKKLSKLGSVTPLQSKKEKPAALRLRIPIEKSRNLYGVADPDPSGVLDYGTCFLQVTVRGTPTVLNGQVVVSKNPCYHRGDVRVLTCVDVKEWRHLVDCIVFPVKGHRPHSNEIAGSDLDGDEYFVCWDEELIPAEENLVDPTNYQDCSRENDSRVTHDDLIRYFANYNLSTVGKLDSLYMDWANACGVASRQCEMIASLFGAAIDSAKTGKKVEIPDFGKAERRPGQKQFVWEKMKQFAMSHRDEKLVQCDAETLTEIFSEAELLELLRTSDSRIPEYNLYRIAYRWCEGSQRMEMLGSLLRYIHFDRMTPYQRQRCENDLCSVANIDVRITKNALYQSNILVEDDIKVLKGAVKEDAWLLYYQSDQVDELSWDAFNNILTMNCHRLICFKLDMAGQPWVIAFSSSQQLQLRDIVDVGHDNKGCSRTMLFVSRHQSKVENEKCILEHKRYVMALDGERLQIYDTEFPHRTGTFLCLMELETRKMGMSVALNRFDANKHLSLEKRVAGARVLRQKVVGVEVYLRHEQPMVAPALLVTYTNDVHPPKNETAADAVPAQECPPLDDVNFPGIGVIPEPVMTELEKKEQFIEELFNDLDNSLMNKTLTGEDVEPVLHLLSGTPELESEIALKLESLLHRSDTAYPDRKDLYVKPLHTLLRYPSTGARLTRLVHTMTEHHVIISASDFLKIMDDVIFCTPDRDVALELLHLLSFADLLNPDEFHIGAAMYYFAHFVAMTTISQQAERCRSSWDAGGEGYEADVFLNDEETPGQPWVMLNIQASSHSFGPHDGVALSFNDQMKRAPNVFMEITDVAGNALTVRVIWPPDGIDQLRTRRAKNPDKRWRADKFPNLVTHRRMIEALKKLCIVGYHDRVPADVLLQLVTSHACSKGLVAAGSDDPEAAKSDTASSPVEGTPGSTQLNDTAINQDDKQESHELSVRAGCSLEGYQINNSQRLAVEAASQRPLTLIQGPPGTGKTHTAAIIIMKWMEMLGNEEIASKILVVAETNEGVNNVVRKLQDFKIDESEIVRFGNPEKMSELSEVSFEHRYEKQAKTNERKFFSQKLADRILAKSKVVCTTCIGAGSSVLQNQRFPYVLIDEAAQALEPAVLVPLVYGAQTICLVGDDKQLPPLVKHPEAGALKKSLFQRLHEGEYEVHLLDRQYRMHPDIAIFPSMEFYDGKLKDGVTCEERTLPKMENCDVWPDKSRPVVFYNLKITHTDGSRSMKGKLKHKGNEQYEGHSICNKVEVRKVIKILEKIRSVWPGYTVGIISPYKAQVQEIKKGLGERDKCVDCVDVRTVDGFQGQERDIIIISTVRANGDTEVKDPVHHVGFVGDPHRMNVMLTRAKMGLVVVGNKETLKSSSVWRNWLKEMKEKRLIVEPPVDADQESGGPNGQSAPARGRGGRGHQERGGSGGQSSPARGRGGRGHQERGGSDERNALAQGRGGRGHQEGGGLDRQTTSAQRRGGRGRRGRPGRGRGNPN